MKVLPKCPSSLKRKRNNKCPVSIGETSFKDQRSIANIRERQRTQNLNSAFENLKKLIPTMATDKLSKIQTLKIAKCYIQFLNGLLNEEPIEKYQHQNELKKGFKIWRMENEQSSSNSQVSSSSDFFIKDEDFEKEDYEKYSFDRDSDDKESFQAHFIEKILETDTKDASSQENFSDAKDSSFNKCEIKDSYSDVKSITYGEKDTFKENTFHFSIYKGEDSISNVIKQFTNNQLQFYER